MDGRAVESDNAFIKGAGDVGDGVADEGEFENFHVICDWAGGVSDYLCALGGEFHLGDVDLVRQITRMARFYS
jgi:hypothetical protein